VAERFFWVCLAQRVSITAFALLAAALHYNFNAPLYPFSGGGSGTAGDDAKFSELLRYFGFTLLVEWSGSTIVTILIAVVFGINVVKVGGIVLARRNLFWLCALCSVHCIADLGMSLNKVVFAPQC
jgi:hypothetical protein